MATKLSYIDWVNICSALKNQRDYIQQWADDSPALCDWMHTLNGLMDKMGEDGANMQEDS